MFEITTLVYSIKAMALMDFRTRDPLSVPISLLSPHYPFVLPALPGNCFQMKYDPTASAP